MVSSQLQLQITRNWVIYKRFPRGLKVLTQDGSWSSDHTDARLFVNFCEASRQRYELKAKLRQVDPSEFEPEDTEESNLIRCVICGEDYIPEEYSLISRCPDCKGV